MDRRLGQLREEFMARELSGKKPAQDFLSEGEALVLDEIRTRYFGPVAQRIVNPQASDDATSDRGFDDPVVQLTLQAVLHAHRRLAALPFVGQVRNEAS
jgi:hypothetical protein